LRFVANARTTQEKISKLIEIWERGNVFPSSMLATFRTAMAARNQPGMSSADGFGRQYSHTVSYLAAISAPAPPAVPATAQTIANMPIAQPTQTPSAPPPTSNGNVIPPQAQYAAPQAQQAHQYTAVQPSTPGIPPPAPAAPGVVAPEVASALASIVPAEVLADPARLPAYLQVLQYLVSNGIPPTQWAQVMQAFHAQATGAVQPQAQAPVQAPPQAQPVVQPIQPPQPVAQLYQPFQPQPAAATPPVPATRRSRSRSPPRRRGSPVYDTYQSVNNNGNGYRQRSPLRDTASTPQADVLSLPNANTTGEKWTMIDPTVPKGNVKVLSRTLFVGGVACSDQELHRIFSRFGLVQSAIVNNEKRHAFVKMCNRNEAVAARDGMENMTDPEVTSKVRKVSSF
jgi:protein NRD1